MLTACGLFFTLQILGVGGSRAKRPMKRPPTSFSVYLAASSVVARQQRRSSLFLARPSRHVHSGRIGLKVFFSVGYASADCFASSNDPRLLYIALLVKTKIVISLPPFQHMISLLTNTWWEPTLCVSAATRDATRTLRNNHVKVKKNDIARLLYLCTFDPT